VTEQRKRKSGETISVGKEEVTLCPFMNFVEGTVLSTVAILELKKWGAIAGPRKK